IYNLLQFISHTTRITERLIAGKLRTPARQPAWHRLLDCEVYVRSRRRGSFLASACSALYRGQPLAGLMTTPVSETDAANNALPDLLPGNPEENDIQPDNRC